MSTWRLRTTRDVTVDECPWLSGTLPEGTEVWTFHKATYGCVDTVNGVAVSLHQDEYPFFELPRSALTEVER